MPTFSHSSLGTFESCPLHYSMRYIQKIKPPDDRESIELFAGKQVHEALAELYLGVKAGRQPSIEEISQVFDEGWKSKLHSGVFSAKAGDEYSIKGYHASGLKWIKDYYAQHAPFTQEQTLQVEWRLSIPLGDKGVYKLNGVIDRLSRSLDGSYTIHDYKTSRTLPSQWVIESDRQLSLYEIGLRKEVDDSKPVKLNWHYLAFGKKFEVQRSREKLGEIEHKTLKLAIQVQGATEENAFPAKIGPLCEYCEYKPICPAWEEARAGNKPPKPTVQTKLSA